MTAINVVRFRVKPGQDEAFIDAHRTMQSGFAGLHSFSLVKTGERAYCVVGEWDSLQSLADARPGMIAQLDRFRSMLEDLGNGLGVTDPVSGEVLVQLRP